ncbi:hypothetical protein PQX77_013317 [Marasmius sp. AFHP31]|nr:hypothetical protein PQX77_013317 [Marasmius sp. AFHP31]
MTRLASLTASCIIVALAVLPTGLAGPACAKKNYSQQLCIERCKARWGYPGSLMGSDRWGSVMRKTTDTSNEAIDAAVAKACGVESTTGVAHGAIATGSESSTAVTSSFTTSTIESITTTSSSTSSSSSSTSSSTSSSSSSSVSSFTPTNNLFDGFSATTTSTSSSTSETPTTTSTTEEAPTSTSTTQEVTTTSEPPPPPPPTTTSSTPESTPTRESGNNGNNNNNDNNGQNQNQGSGNSGSTSGGDIDQYLSAHNSIRAQHGASDLTWSDEAAAKAQEWANKCVFEHSGGVLGAFGENLAAGTGSSYGIKEAVKGWTDEVSEYSVPRSTSTPISRSLTDLPAEDYNSGNPKASHFTQVVWKATKQVGCAVAACDGIFDAKFGKAQYHVCEYFPQGNVIGQFDVNVQA